MKKIIAVLMAVLIFFTFCLTGCGGGDKNPEKEADNEKQNEITESENKGKQEEQDKESENQTGANSEDDLEVIGRFEIDNVDWVLAASEKKGISFFFYMMDIDDTQIIMDYFMAAWYIAMEVFKIEDYVIDIAAKDTIYGMTVSDGEFGFTKLPGSDEFTTESENSYKIANKMLEQISQIEFD